MERKRRRKGERREEGRIYRERKRQEGKGELKEGGGKGRGRKGRMGKERGEGNGLNLK